MSLKGSFLSPLGNPYAARALPPSSLNEPYYVYMVEKNIPMYYGKIAPAFDMPGGGVQYMIDFPTLARKHNIPTEAITKNYSGGAIKWLVDNGYLSRLTSIGGIKP